MKTKEKIVHDSLNLFNKNTFEKSTTNLIAKNSEVLEGSLWYHFNSKQDLVSVHTDLFLDSFNRERVHSKKNNSKELILSLFSIYEVLWDYRYLMRDSFELFSIDNPKLYKKIIDINCEIDVWAKEAIIHAKNIRVLIIQNEDIESLVEISLIIGRHWLDYSMKKYPFKSDLYLRKKGINLLIKTLYPYLSGDSKIIMDSIYESD